MTIRTLTLALACAAGPALAELPVGAQVSLLPGWRMENGHHMAALQVALEPGWKTYWRAPGEGGIPPELDWSGSHNIASVAFHWPVPEVFESGGMTTIGYHDVLILPIEITPETIGADIEVSADLLLGICEEICVPMPARLDADLPADATRPDPRIALALDRRPHDAQDAGVAGVHCASEALKDGVRITAALDLPRLGGTETVVMEHDDARVWVSESIGGRDAGGRLTVYADLVPPAGAPFPVAAGDLRFTVIGEGRAVDIRGCDAMEPR